VKIFKYSVKMESSYSAASTKGILKSVSLNGGMSTKTAPRHEKKVTAIKSST